MTTEPGRREPTTDVRTFCRICQAYCGLVVDVEDGVVRRVRGDRDHPLSHGYTCTKGRALGELHRDPRRLTAHRLQGADAPREAVLDDLAARLRGILDDHGPDAVAFYRGTAAYFDSAGLVALGALITGLRSRSLYTTSTIDQVARFWVAELMCGSFAALPLIDQDRTALTVLVATNPPVSHGHVNAWPDPVNRLRRLAERGELWCIDVRATETAAIAQHHVAPMPGSDWAILGHVVREVLRGGADQRFVAERTEGVEVLRAAVEPLDRRRAAEVAGVAPGALDALVDAVRRAGRLAVQTGTGTTMGPFGDVTEWMAWALMAVTGSLDRRSGVWFSPGFLRRRSAPAAPSAEPGPPSRPGLVGRFGERPTAALVDEIESGNVRALIVTGGNPLRAVPGTPRLARAFATLEVLAVADVLTTATVEAATHVLACSAQLERADVTLVEAMAPQPAAQYTPALVDAPGGTRPLVELLAGLAARLGVPLPSPDAEATFDLLAGARATSLREQRVLVGEPSFGWFTEQVLPGGRWSLAPAPLVSRMADALAGAPVAPGSVLLTPRRQIGHMNTLLAGRTDAPDLLVSEADAEALGVDDGDLVDVSTGTSTVAAALRIADIRPGVVSLPHGYDAPNVAELTTDTDAVHPDYGMPTLGAVPVTLTPRERP